MFQILTLYYYFLIIQQFHFLLFNYNNGSAKFMYALKWDVFLLVVEKVSWEYSTCDNIVFNGKLWILFSTLRCYEENCYCWIWRRSEKSDLIECNKLQFIIAIDREFQIEVALWIQVFLRVNLISSQWPASYVRFTQELWVIVKDWQRSKASIRRS